MDPHRAHAGGATALDVGALQVADVHRVARRDAERSQRGVEHAPVRLRHADLVREDLHFEQLEQTDAREELAHDAAAAEAGVADERGAHAAAAQRFEHVARARQRGDAAREPRFLEAMAERRDRAPRRATPTVSSAQPAISSDPLPTPRLHSSTWRRWAARIAASARSSSSSTPRAAAASIERGDAQGSRRVERVIDEQRVPTVEGDGGERLHENSSVRAAR